MNKIIQFPIKEDIDWESIKLIISPELDNVIPEVRDKIKKEVIALLKKYSVYDKKISLSFPESITGEQIKEMEDAFENRNNLIKTMLGDIVKAITELSIEQNKNS